MAASRMKCLCSGFSGERYVPTYAFLRLDVYHYSALLPSLQSLPSPDSIHPLHPKRRLRLNKHITKLKYLQVPLLSTQPLFFSPVSQWDSRGRTCIDAHLNKARCRLLYMYATSPFLLSGSAAHTPKCQA